MNSDPKPISHPLPNQDPVSFCLALLAAAIVGLYLTIPLRDPDLWWHIVIGRWIVAQRDVPIVDHWTMLSSGTPWRAYSWLPEILFASVDRWGGLRGLFYLQTMLGIGLASSFIFVLTRLSRSAVLGVLFGVALSLSCFSHFSLRPQTFTWIYFAAALFVADGISRKGFTQVYCAALYLIFLLWANTHFSSVLGLGGVFFWILDRRGLRDALLSTLIAFVATFVTPYLGGEWLTLFETASHPFRLGEITEFRAPGILEFQTVFTLLFSLVTLLLWLEERRRYFRLLLAVGFVGAGLTVVKFLPYANICVLTLCASLLRDLREAGPSSDRRLGLSRAFYTLQGRVQHLPPLAGVALLGGTAAVLLFQVAHLETINRRALPVAAMDYLASQNFPGVLANDFSSGGYVLYRQSNFAGEPSAKVMIDGRTNLIAPDVWEKHKHALLGFADWRDYFNLIHPGIVVWPVASPIVNSLQDSGEWCQVFPTKPGESDYAVFAHRDTPGHCAQFRPETLG